MLLIDNEDHSSSIIVASLSSSALVMVAPEANLPCAAGDHVTWVPEREDCQYKSEYWIYGTGSG